jgi:hypothetical protein
MPWCCFFAQEGFENNKTFRWALESASEKAFECLLIEKI